jgi:hypothetical protein
MPYLGDYLGHLLSEITNARVQADLEAVRIAELYASHPLLKHMPVPHFRLPTLTMDVPVVVKEMEETKGKPEGKAILPKIRKNFNRLLVSHLKQSGLVLSKDQMTGLKQSLDKTMSGLKQPTKVPLSVTHIADELVFTAIKTLRDTHPEKDVEPERFDKLADELKTAVHVDFTKYLTAPKRLNVLVTTAELREAGPSDILAHLHLSISEQAVEWSVIESKGKPSSRLIPE